MCANLAKTRIKPLSIQLANQIAAGEVVERPASVLKELLENSIDSQCTSIEVEILNGGKSLIRVNDNGNGINKDDLHLAVSRHATSKLSSINDLHFISSLGFRGEALASISSISRLSIQSKFKSSNQAWGIDTSSDTDFTNYQATIIPAALNAGTLVEVRDLFYNTPARRKFLRTNKTEFRFIDEIFKRIALSHFNIAFKLSHNNKLVKKLSVSNNHSFRLNKLFGDKFSLNFIKIEKVSHHFSDLGELQLSGWVSTTSYLRNQSDQQYFYVNGRFIRDKLFNHALRQAYQDSLPSNKYASYILYLSIDPSQVDINVHPTKHEVRFSQSRIVHDFVVSVILRHLTPLNTDITFSDQTLDYSQIDKPPSSSSSFNYGLPTNHLNTLKQSTINENRKSLTTLYKPSSNNTAIDSLELKSLISSSDQNIEKEGSLFSGKILASVDSILIAKDGNKVWLIESLKVAEHINLLHLMDQIPIKIQALDLRSQKLLIPKSFNLGELTTSLFVNYQSILSRFGINFSSDGHCTFYLKSFPKLPYRVDTKELLNSLSKLLSSSDVLSNTTSYLDDKKFVSALFSLLAASIDKTIFNDIDQQLLIINTILEFKEKDKLEKYYKVLTDTDLRSIILK